MQGFYLKLALIYIYIIYILYIYTYIYIYMYIYIYICVYTCLMKYYCSRLNPEGQLLLSLWVDEMYLLQCSLDCVYVDGEMYVQ